MSLPPQLLMRDLLKRRVRCSQGLDRGNGVAVWMHPPVHRVLGWVSRPSMFGERRLVWRLDQLRDFGELEALVKGEPADTDSDTIQRLPTLFEADLLDRHREPIGTLVDAAVDLRSGRILEYLVSRSDPRLPGSSRWRLSPERIVDQQPGRVYTALEGLDDLPMARASVRQEWLRRSRRWRDQMEDAGNRLEQRVEGWLEEPPWDGTEDRSTDRWAANDMPEPWDDRWDDQPAERAERRAPGRAPRADDDPWI
ncbi:MAG: RNA methyltransferase [Cyanobacteriota bacterium]|nr:RNA methyltransferase [Cyanobacteriota bacterium]